jgi:hypothetical protein
MKGGVNRQGRTWATAGCSRSADRAPAAERKACWSPHALHVSLARPRPALVHMCQKRSASFSREAYEAAPAAVPMPWVPMSRQARSYSPRLASHTRNVVASAACAGEHAAASNCMADGCASVGLPPILVLFRRQFFS